MLVVEVGLHEKVKIPHPDQWAGMAGTEEELVCVITEIHQYDQVTKETHWGQNYGQSRLISYHR